MLSVNVIYDDRVKPAKGVATINGGRCFGDTVYKRKTLFERFKCLVPDVIRLSDEGFLSVTDKGLPVCHVFSSHIVVNNDELKVLLTKAVYAKEVYQVLCGDDSVAMLIFPNTVSYDDYIENGLSIKPMIINSGAFRSINGTESFTSFITGGFDARFFNSLEGDFYTVTKSSSNVKKLKKEHDYYYLLPDDMKHYFVQPYGYKEENGRAFYTMERCHMTDIAIRYVHGAIDEEEFSNILLDVFEFVGKRLRKRISFEEYVKLRDSLYLDKVKERIEAFKANEGYSQIAGYIENGTAFSKIADIFNKYEAVYNRVVVENDFKNRKNEYYSVVSHGDLCFSNILYHKDARLLKLIDVKGAETEQELYLDEYYDLAKLSHSICGLYDYFNAAMYDISLDENMKLHLEVDKDNTREKALFENILIENGYSLKRVRLYEASLFLSMLPLHMDNPNKVMGFILNAINILDECDS